MTLLTAPIDRDPITSEFDSRINGHEIRLIYATNLTIDEKIFLSRNRYSDVEKLRHPTEIVRPWFRHLTPGKGKPRGMLDDHSVEAARSCFGIENVNDVIRDLMNKGIIDSNWIIRWAKLVQHLNGAGHD